MAKARQLVLALPQHGGKRRGAGRKATGPRDRVSHKARPRFAKPAAVHVTLRVGTQVWNLRSRRCFKLIEASLENARERFGLRVIEFSVLGNHLHLLVEADCDVSLSRGMQGLAVRIAKALNRLMQRSGAVFADHYHSRVLNTPTEVVDALAYVLGNYAHHFGGAPGNDPFSSGAYDGAARSRFLAVPVTWLVRVGWRRAKRIPQWLRVPKSEGTTPRHAACCAAPSHDADSPSLFAAVA